MDESDDLITNYIILVFLCGMIGWLIWKHTGTEEGQIGALYWAGVATPLLSQITKKVFNLIKKN
ncbi:MAG: hypothetical protein QGG97_04555 [Flavobacteriales bacterium]|jgi:hypothetical protein|nr:hypothetical protein [Flavobacteriales bacterium]|tara:strand:- start:805 stop:996 length:192 start_codon:yes stop_codon:yes gene_type:complete